MSQRFVQHPWITDVLTTTNATTATSTITQYTVPLGSAGIAEIVALARNTTDSTSATVHMIAAFKNVAGTLSFPGGGPFSFGSISTGSGDMSVNIAAGFTQSGTTIQPQVTGAAAKTMEWFIDVRYSVN